MKLLFAGDVFITKPEQFILEPSLQKFISAHEVACCNFEGPVESKSLPILKRGINLYQSKRMTNVTIIFLQILVNYF